MFEHIKRKFSDFYKKNETQVEVGFFIGGFIFDVIMISEVDDFVGILQQAFYLWALASMLHYELLFSHGKWAPRGRWTSSFWDFRSLIFHFIMGNLLNLYSLLYIKSASILNSLIFLFIMIGLILGNELPSVKKSHVSFKVGLYGICLFSFFAVLFPVVLGFLGWIPFGLALAATLGVFYWQFRWLKKSLPDDSTLFRVILAPGVAVLTFFMSFYFMGWIPPVPLSVNQQGIYHLVDKKDGNYILSTEKKWWKFWHSGDQDFLAEPGDKIYFYAEIFSPARFSDKVYVHWSWLTPKGEWQNSDRIPLQVVGGRKSGYRGFTTKSNYQAGSWRVQVKTENGQEISRLYFDVEVGPASQNRIFSQILR
ncbi:MAG: DUF2914 domain-containing protein [Bdellovibrionaceae bacterium]|nr:DUF2914 domain-containing protein [Pseudobdellovibrionaceae bacterium]